MIVFAYDGSLNGDWVAHYAIRFAENGGRRLRLVHVETTKVPRLEDSLARLQGEARHAGLELEVDLVRGASEVVGPLLARAEGATLITGTRARPRNRALLADTVSARLLERARGPVVALHVVHPGLLGQPQRVLVAGVGPRDPEPLPLLRLLGPELHAVHVVLVHPVPTRWLAPLVDDRRWLEDGRRRLVAIERRLREGLDHPFQLDGSVVVSSDPARDVRLRALAHRSRLIALDAGLGGAAIEAVLAAAPADVAIHRSPP